MEYLRAVPDAMVLVLNKDERAEVANLFEGLRWMDNGMVLATRTVSDWLRSAANDIKPLLDEARYEEAQDRVRNATHEAAPLIEDVRRSLERMWRLEAALRETTGAV